MKANMATSSVVCPATREDITSFLAGARAAPAADITILDQHILLVRVVRGPSERRLRKTLRGGGYHSRLV
jgi:hypothetical protein